jgi:hypothetical protein
MKLGNWTVVFEDKKIQKNTQNGTEKQYIQNDSFWNQSKFSNIWAIQYTGIETDTDQVEYRDNTPNSSYDSSILGNFQDFIDEFDKQHLLTLQNNWDNNNLENETSDEKITRLGARPTTYSS